MSMLKDLVGKRFGRLTVIKRSYPNTKKGETNWLCKCECGTKKVIYGDSLRSGHTQSCGCLQRERAREENLKDLTGQIFGRLTVIKRDYSDSGNGKHIKWLCKCECGKEKLIAGYSLKTGNTKSCGCLQKELVKERRRLNIGIASMRAMINGYKKGAKRRGIEYKLTEEQFKNITQQDCFYCGEKPNNRTNVKNSFGDYIYNGIDRVDNKKGYTIENSVPCCFTCNRAKDVSTQQEFKDWIERVYNKMFFGR